MREHGTVLSIQVGRPRRIEDEGEPWFTSIFKTPVAGAVWLGRENLEGDAQADLSVHGGPEKAVLAYAAEHYLSWREEIGAKGFNYGAFGENLTVAGLTEEDVAIGDTYQVGAARVQVSQPRGPCWKLARRFKLPQLPSRVLKTGRTGWYLRVLEEGSVETGVAMRLVERPFPQWTIARVNVVAYQPRKHKEAVAELAACPFLAASWREWLSA